jgi:cell division septation protein DedD
MNSVLIGQGRLVEAEETAEAAAESEPGPAWETEDAVALVEPVTTWRKALAARVRPSDHHISAEEIFAILNGWSEGDTAAERCAAAGVTVPMYCVWKSKYQQLGLDQLRNRRRYEYYRRHAVIGLVLLSAIVLTGGTAASLVWAVSSTFTILGESTLAIPAVESDDRQTTPSGGAATNLVRARAVSAVEPRSPADAPAADVKTGYRIQVRAAETDREGRALVDRLTSQGYSAYMTRAVVGNSDVFRVRVGPFDTFSAAEEIAVRLRSDGYDGAWIAR